MTPAWNITKRKQCSTLTCVGVMELRIKCNWATKPTSTEESKPYGVKHYRIAHQTNLAYMIISVTICHDNYNQNTMSGTIMQAAQSGYLNPIVLHVLFFWNGSLHVQYFCEVITCQSVCYISPIISGPKDQINLISHRQFLNVHIKQIISWAHSYSWNCGWKSVKWTLSVTTKLKPHEE
jgi:hypothetical protein